MSWPAGEIETTETAMVDHIDAPAPVDWAWIEEDRRRMEKISPYLISLADLQSGVNAGKAAVYALKVNGERVGSMALQTMDWRGDLVLDVMWLRTEPGRLTSDLQDLILSAFWRLVTAHDARELIVTGRPGWEALFLRKGVKVHEMARIWRVPAQLARPN